MLTPNGTWIMTPEELAAQRLRPGLWEFTHNDDGHTETIRLHEREDESGRFVIYPETDMPTVDIEEMLMAGRFTRFLGP